jgi:hypothetical protein
LGYNLYLQGSEIVNAVKKRCCTNKNKANEVKATEKAEGLAEEIK